ncbi:heme oxygenase [Oceanisphaera litoralis]|uniref:biliverdin-producing heme oxygenase n=1 Tax=Oceanisphaera litoralis TaxID=225144 RepID=UPI00195A450D|nr:biliverdin-producing heme oxygenase [Oceanisphaera litoralis]MBM7454692.1 heme oxygenase [Oceanisphaera litoralis]
MKVTSALAACLRQATRDAHRRLDSHGVLRPLISPSLSYEEYQRALLALYPAQWRLEKSIARGLDALHQDYPMRPRAPALADDLAAMVQPLPALDETVMLEVCRPGQLIGLLYVLEGARLGSRIIAHNVHRTLGRQVPSRYFTVVQDDDSWSVFWQFAERYCSESEQMVAAVAADSAFRLFLSCLDTSHTTETVICL